MDNKTYLFGFTFRLILCVVAIWLLSTAVHAQEKSSPLFCSYYGETINPDITIAETNDGASEIIEKILSVVGLKPNFEIRSANVPNAAAVILNNKRYILYNPKFINQINYVSGNDWAGISIIAHEIGHHLNGHTLKSGGSRPDLELEADEFSGFVLCKLGASKQDAQAAMNVAASQKSSHTHPARKDRLVSIANGWNNANTQSGAIANTSRKSNPDIQKPVVIENHQTSQAVLDERLIAFDVSFDEDADSDYFITTKGDLVMVDDNSVYLIGRLAESNRRGYRLMLSDKNYNYLYIAPQGKIVNGSGKSVGYIDKH